MDEYLVIDSVGPQMLTVAVAGAEHSMSISPGVLRISRPGETFDCYQEDFPVTYKVTELKGRLSICDSKGRMVWCWRLLARTESQTTRSEYLASQLTAPELASASSLAPSDRQASQVAGRSNTSDAARAAAKVGKGLVSWADADEAADVSIVSNRNKARKERQASDLNLGATSSTIDACLTTSSAPSKPKRAPKRKNQDWSGVDSNDVHDNTPNQPWLRSSTKSSRKNDQVPTESHSNTSREKTLTERRPQSSPQSSKRVPKGSDHIASDARTKDMTPTQTAYLLKLIYSLLREHEEDARPFAKPVNIVTLQCPDYYDHVKEPINLQTMKYNLSGNYYTSVRAFESHFDLMIINAIRYNGADHVVAKHGLCLSHAFNSYIKAMSTSQWYIKNVTRQMSSLTDSIDQDAADIKAVRTLNIVMASQSNKDSDLTTQDKFFRCSTNQESFNSYDLLIEGALKRKAQ